MSAGLCRDTASLENPEGKWYFDLLKHGCIKNSFAVKVRTADVPCLNSR